MAEIVMIHSFRRGVGRTLLTANLAAAIAAQGFKVGLIDTDLELPELHLAFVQGSPKVHQHLNNVLWDEIPVEQAVVDVSGSIGDHPGKLYLLSSNDQPEAISSAQRKPLKIEQFGRVLERFIEVYDLDYIVMDSSAGLDEKTMSLLGLTDILLVLLRPDQQEYQGTALLIEIGTRFNIPELLVVTNEVGENLDHGSIKEEVKKVFHADCAAILPHNEHLQLSGKGSLLVITRPDNPVAVEISRLALQLTKERK